MKRAIVALALLGAAPAYAQSPCPMPTLAQIHAKGVFEGAIVKARALGKERGEFETTAAYQARMAKAISAIAPSGSLTFPWMANRAAFSFDADAGTVTYANSTLDTLCEVNPSSTAYGLSRPFCIEETARSTRDRAQVMANAFGAKAVVSPTHEMRVGIALNPDGHVDGGPLGYEAAHLFQFQASVTEAQSLKKNGVVIVMMTPKAPLFVEGSHYSGATIDNPDETYGEDYLLIGDIVCLSLADDATGRVYQSIAVGPIGRR